MKRSEALRLRALIEQAVASLHDKEASEGATLFPRMKGDGSLVDAGTRVNWHGVVKRCRVALWDNTENDPDHAPNLWEDIAYRQGIRIIPDTITADGAFALDECGWRGDELYRSKIPANVHTPEQYPAGWELVV